MKSILLILSATGSSERALKRAIDLCKQSSAPLVAAHIQDREITDSLEKRALVSGFLGDQVGEMIHDALEKDGQLRGEERLAQIEATAEESGVECKTLQASGRLAPTVIRLVAEHGAGHVVVSSEPRSLLARLVFGSPINELKRAVNLAVEIIEEREGETP